MLQGHKNWENMNSPSHTTTLSLEVPNLKQQECGVQKNEQGEENVMTEGKQESHLDGKPFCKSKFLDIAACRDHRSPWLC